MEWEEEPVFQSARRNRHLEVCRELLIKGAAYPCFCSVDDLRVKREKALQEKGEYQYDRSCRSIPTDEAAGRMESGDTYTLRIKVPDGETTFEDAVRGVVTVQHTQIDNFILLRSDKSPVYQVAVVVDDHDMDITHVIRGDDHLSNTPKQILIYRAMGWNLPVFAHVPMILGSDKKRLSKRHGATSVEEYRDSGYMPEAVANFLVLLGWSPGDNREIMSLQDMVDSFSLDRISKNPAVFDETKLEWMNAQYIMKATEDELLDMLTPVICVAGLANESFVQEHKDYLLACIGLMHERMKTLVDFIQNGRYYFKDPDQYDEAAVKKIWMKEGSLDRLRILVEALEGCSEWSEASLESIVQSMADRLEVGLGKILQPARLALTGSSASPGMFELMEVLGMKTTMRRLRKAIDYLMLK